MASGQSACERLNGIRVAVHNHPKPSGYYDPNSVLKMLKPLDKRIGASPDIGHWMRSGFDPVKSLKLLKGRVLTLHIKDIEQAKPGSEDVVFGKGVTGFPAVFKELAAQRFDGVAFIDTKADQPDPTAQVRASIAYLHKILEK